MPRLTRPLHVTTTLLALTLSAPLFAQTPAAPTAEPGQPAPREATLHSTGNARVSRAPDYVDVTVGVVSIEDTATAAQTTATEVMRKTVDALRALKLSGEDLQTGRVELAPRYDARSYAEGEPRLIGYTATATLRVRTTDLQSPARVIDTALSAGCNRVDGVQFGLTQAIEAREEAVRLATQAARRKARVMADALEVRIDRVLSASNSSGYYGGWYARGQMAQMSNVAADGPSGGGAGDDTNPVVPGKIEIWAEATITFAAVPAAGATPSPK